MLPYDPLGVHSTNTDRVNCPRISGKEKAHKHKYFWPVTPPVTGVSRPGGQGSKIYVLSSEPNVHKSFGPGTRPGGTGDRGDRTEFYVIKFYVPSLLPRLAHFVDTDPVSIHFLIFLFIL